VDHSVPVRSLLWSDKYVKLERFAKLAEMVPSKELSEKSNVSREDSSPISDRRPDKPGFLARFKCFNEKGTKVLEGVFRLVHCRLYVCGCIEHDI